MTLGTDFMLFAQLTEGGAYTAIALSTSCKISLNTAMIDTANKTSGIWASNIPGKLSWSISTDCLINADPAQDAKDGYAILKNIWRERKRLKLHYSPVKTNETGDIIENTAQDIDEGYGYIASLERNDPDNEKSTFSLSITGDGKLAPAEKLA